MEEELEEREMILRQKALNTLPQKRKGYRDKQEADFGIDALLAGDSRLSHSGGSTSRDRHSHYPTHGSSRELRMPQDTSRGRAKLQRDGERQLRGRKASSSHSSSRSGSASVSYSSYSTSGSSTSGSRSRSSSSRSHSSYSSYTRSSYSSSRRSYSASPHPTRRTKKEHHSLHKGPHSDPRPKVSSKVPPHHRYPASSQWYEGEHTPAYTSSRSPPRARKGHQPSRITSHGSKDYGDEYPPAKRRPPADYPEYRRGPLPTERHRLHTPPPPPPPPPPSAVHRKERVVRHMRRSPPHRSPPPYGNRPPYSRGPPSPSPHYPTSHHGPRRRSFSSPPPPTRPSHDTRPKRRLVSDRMTSRPSSRDLRSLCGPPIHVRDRLHHHSPDRRAPRLPAPRPEREPYRSGASASREHNPRESRRMGVERKRESYPPLATRSRVDKAVSSREYARRSNIHVHVESSSRKEKTESSKAPDKIHVRYSDKEKTSADEQDKSSAVPSLVSPTAQLLWEEGEEKEEPDEGSEVKVKVAEEGEEGEVEELDYDESMEDLDLHPTGNIDEGEGDEESRAHRLSVASDSRPGTMSWDDSEEGEREEANEGISGHSEELTKSDPDMKSHPKRHEGSPPDGGALSEGSGTEDNVHISSPIRVSPERREPRVVQRSPRCEEDGRLSAKERLYVSKNAIEEKKLRMSRRNEDTASKLPRSLANRLGPSPGLRGRRSDRPKSGHKGSALAIAAEYKRRKQAGELSPREAARASMITKRINESEYKSDYKPMKHRKAEERSEENERELDRRIDSIKQRNKALEKRHKEIEKDKQLYG